MTDHNYAPNNMQLYQELRKRFPNAAHGMLMETIERHGNNLQRCIEDLYLNSPGQFNLSSHIYNMNMQRSPYPTGTDNRQPNPATGARSRSVSGVPGVRGDDRFGHGLGYPNKNQNEGQHPQSAPVISGCNSPFSSGVRFSFSKNNSAENMVASSREQPALYASSTYSPMTSTVTTTIPKAKPPVPPPTYRSHIEQPQHYHQYPGNNTREQHHSLYPVLPAEMPNEHVPSSPQQQIRHKTSLSLIPSSPQMMVNYRPEYNPWGSPSIGWDPSMGTHSTSVNFQLGKPTGHSEVQISTSGMNYGCKSPVTPNAQLSPRASRPSPQTSSRLHISITPQGGVISAMRGQINPRSPLPNARFQLQIPSEGSNPINNNLSPSSASSPSARPSTSQASPRVSPQLLEESFYGPRNIFDEDDPGKDRVTQSILKPVPSPRMDESSAWSDEARWSATPPSNDVCVTQNELCSGEAYSQALLTHQKQKFSTLQRELERDRAQLQLYRREVASNELFSFQRQICQDPTFFTFRDLQNLRAEIRSLMVDCQCMTRLVDLLHKGQVPLGETNEDFYKTIHTGQQGPVYAPAPLQIGIPPSVPMPRLFSEHSRPSQPLPHQPYQSLPPVTPEVVSPKPPPQDEDDEGQRWECCACTFHNNTAMVMCEMCEMPKFVQASSMSNQRGGYLSSVN